MVYLGLVSSFFLSPSSLSEDVEEVFGVGENPPPIPLLPLSPPPPSEVPPSDLGLKGRREVPSLPEEEVSEVPGSSLLPGLVVGRTKPGRVGRIRPPGLQKDK